MSPSVLPEYIAASSPVVLRRWVPADAAIIGQLVIESLDHLRPWMPWIAHEPQSLTQRRELVEQWERDWGAGGDVVMGVFVDGQAAGGCGLHRRIGPDGLEIGYWMHPAFLRRGLVTEAAGLLTSAGLSVPEITHVEIHHDEANRASAGVPRKLGYELVAKVTQAPAAPAESGRFWHWRMTREHWRLRGDGGAD